MKMTIRYRQFYVTAVMVVALLFVGFLFASAQEAALIAEPPVEPEVADVVAATSTAEAAAATTTSNPYRTEMIEGNISVGDFVVGPGKTELDLQPGDTRVVEIAVTNRISDNRVFKIEIEDIVGAEDGSGGVTLLDEGGPYQLRDYLSVPQEEFELRLGERAWIPVTITIPADAEPGGIYGSLLVSTVQKSETEQENVPQNPIIARVGSLFFVTVNGEGMRAGSTIALQTIPEKTWYNKGPITFGIVYENTGTLHVTPSATLSITNMFGAEVGYAEAQPWFVLPQSIRTKEIVWDTEFLFGRYTATAKVQRGYDDIVDEQQLVFWVVPWQVMLGVFAAVFLFVFIIRFFSRSFEIKRK